MIRFEGVSKMYDNNKIAVDNINVEIEDGEFVVFIGTSGSGKTTCLRMINRMIDVTKGYIFIEGIDIKKINEVDLRRRIGYVIQQIGLMPHMTIYENIVMVPRLLKWGKTRIDETVNRLLECANLPHTIINKYPSQLSGGQQQRVGVIRALAADQNIILMDEPFGALDPITRSSLQNFIKELHRDLHKTFVLVTHDIDEALLLADKIVIMDNGQVIQMDTPCNILKYPTNEFVEEILGERRMRRAKFEALTAEETMYTNFIAIHVDSSISSALQKMIEKELEYLYVTDSNSVLKGFVDIYKLSEAQNKEEVVMKYLLETPYINHKTPVRKALTNFTESGYKKLPVVNEKRQLLGEISRSFVDKLLLD